MNIFLLSLISKSIGGAMIRLSQLPLQTSIIGLLHKQVIAGLADKVFDTYINFFESVRVIPLGFTYKRVKISKKLGEQDFISGHLTLLDRKLINLLQFPLETTVSPVDLRIIRPELLQWYSGIVLSEQSNHSAEFYLNELSISRISIRYSSENLHYLDRLLDGEQILASVSPRKLAAEFGKNYNQFQSDCRNHFGDTFHQFRNKMKMLHAVCDVLFTNCSYKEIAYRNNFLNYNSMYTLFHYKYKFPIDSIPRLLMEI
jgi:AraC-like DNA-binding protein